jgi:hypothetical protein
MNPYDIEHHSEEGIVGQCTGQEADQEHDDLHERKPLTMNGKMEVLMTSLETERQRSSELLEELRLQSKTSSTLKKTVLGLCVFTVILAVANVGTSMATAMMIKDTKVNAQGDLVNLQGVRLGTTSKSMAFEIMPLPANSNRRHLQSLVCGSTTGTEKMCIIQGQMMMSDAVKLYQQFCPTYPYSAVCASSGINDVQFHCQGKISTLFGGPYLPSTGPTDNGQFVAFPTSGQGYYGHQIMLHSSSTSTSIATPGDYCVQPFTTGIYCYKDGTPCLVFAAWTSACTGSPAVEVCPNNAV